jgi:pyruvate/2-oxoglutarate dehydrogenase complex dihydrolipoamide dehydrogenase (E3) component
MQATEFDLVVSGSGPAGQKGAICAVKRKKVAALDGLNQL